MIEENVTWQSRVKEVVVDVAVRVLLIGLIASVFVLALAVLSQDVKAEGVQPTQQYAKIYLSPFYLSSMTLNTNYTYTVSVHPPDGISKIVNAIVSLNAQINGQTQTFTMWVNNKPCNNPTYSVATAFSTTGNVQMYFDCSNVITQVGTYTIVLRSAVNTGAITGWLDVTYMNNPQGKMDIFGTEYYENDDGTLFLLLKDSNGLPVSNATCTIDIYYPNIAQQTHPEWIDNALMRYLEEGLYYYDFVTLAISGLYMANAQCTYITDHNRYYPAYSVYKPIRTGVVGTYTGDTFVLNDYTDWIYTQCDSATVGGNKVCDSYYDFTVGENITRLFLQYTGESNGAPTMVFSVWNYSSSSWITLPNTLLFHATAVGVPSGVDEYQSNEIPDLTRTIAANKTVRIRTYTSAGSTFKLFSNWLTLDASKYSTNIQDLKGSGEIHVSSVSPSQVEARFYRVDSCDGYTDGRCAFPTNDEEFDVPEGELEDYLNITAISSRTGWSVMYNSPFSVDCTALMWIKEWNGSVWNDFTDYETYSQPALENCQIKINHALTSGASYAFWIKFDNYMKWEVDYSKTIADIINTSIVTLCDHRNITYEIPITETTVLFSDPTLNFCHHAFDDIYYINQFYSDSIGVSTAGEYASFLQEMRFYRREMYDRYIYLSLNGNTTLIPSYVWNHPIRNLTYYAPTTITFPTYANLTASEVWNYASRNLTWFPTVTFPTYSNLTASQVWQYIDRNLTYYQMPYIPGYVNLTAQDVWAYGTRTLTDYAVSTISSAVWTQSDRNLTNYFDPTSNVWSYVDRNLTWFPPYQNPATDIWTYQDRNLTYYAYTNPAGDIWTYTDRNLTYYPPTGTSNLTEEAVTDIVSSIWNYTNKSVETGQLWVGGTEYSEDEGRGRVVVRVLDSVGNPVLSATCNMTVYTPQTPPTVLVSQIMSGMATGVYYADITLSNVVGVYTYTVDCVKGSKNYYLMGSYHVYNNNMTGIATNVWDYTNRTLTYYPNGISEADIWNYSARYIHGEII